MKATNIKWDVDDYEDDLDVLQMLPDEIDIPEGMTDEEEISDWITEQEGICNKGFLLED